MNDLPQPIAQLVDELAAMPGAVAVVLGGSRALGTNDAGSDWDLGLYYRGAIELTALAAHGTVYPPGSWGRIMNGGAWRRWMPTCADCGESWHLDGSMNLNVRPYRLPGAMLGAGLETVTLVEAPL